MSKRSNVNVVKYTKGYLCAKFERLILIYDAMFANTWRWPTCSDKIVHSDSIVMKLKLDMSCLLLNIYTKFQNDISKCVETKFRKTRTDRRTDGGTNENCHVILRPFFKRTYKIHWTTPLSYVVVRLMIYIHYKRDIFQIRFLQYCESYLWKKKLRGAPQ